MRIAVVIPCRNEKNHIKECVDAIYHNKLDESVSMSVYVVDGLSDDGTRELIEKMQLNYQTLHCIDNIQKLTPYAFNLGIKASAKPDYIQIVGARQILSENYLQNALKVLKNDPSIWCIGGAVNNVYLNETGKIISKAMSTSFGMGLGNFRTLDKSGFTDTVGTPMYPYWVFDKIGFFDEELVRNQDDDFNFRVTQAGGKIWYENAISLKYYVRGDFKGLWRQFFQYGYWKVYVNQKHKSVTTLRQLVPPLFVFYLGLWLLSLLTGFTLFAFTTVPIILYLILGIYYSSKVSTGNKEFWSVFKTFPILHISYGLGYLKGIWEFLVMNRKPSNKQKRLSR